MRANKEVKSTHRRDHSGPPFGQFREACGNSQEFRIFEVRFRRDPAVRRNTRLSGEYGPSRFEISNLKFQIRHSIFERRVVFICRLKSHRTHPQFAFKPFSALIFTPVRGL